MSTASTIYEVRETLLKLENISHSYSGRPILKEVNAEVKNVHVPGREQGQIVGLLGPSGVGKTTLFRILAGLMEPTSGRVLLGADGHPVKRGTVGVVAQDYPLFAHRTVLSNLLVATDNDAAKAMNLLERFGMAEHAKKYPIQLSGGQRQRVAIAQQLLCSEFLVLMDEPFSGLDPVAVQNVIKLLGEAAAVDEQKTFVLVTHDIEAAVETCDTLWLLGRDRDEVGNPIPGARVQKVFDLMACGLAWREGITGDPEYQRVLAEIHALFPRL
ncbi:MAG: ATP-binding cassette domain-containing protein [Armatimonadetes bacterium]|nr:ATP-binding cassette domain-containing protein [Armatimonadota bacterium]